mmetsp:Transcript_31763/g.68082  ORF Transcript_31763/g.68082 Transcript_31763/m.68082 type:complete len:289 (+) Transcript_31763:1323-2189(+)
MGTSFAPSPTARVIRDSSFDRTSSTSRRFCCGAKRQQMQTLLAMPMWKSNSWPSSSSATNFMDPPSKTKATWESPWACVLASLSISLALTTEVALTTVTTVMLSVNKWQAFAISTAVSTLSPVRTHIRMPIAFSVDIAAGTPSWRRSSMPLMPVRLKVCSNCRAHAAIFSGRSSMGELRATSILGFQLARNSGEIGFQATTRVLSPILAYASICCKDASAKEPSQSGPMTLSAPFVMHISSPSTSQMTLIRFLSEEKGTWATSITCFDPCGVSMVSCVAEEPSQVVRR